MSSNKPVKTVSVKCACGAMFDREVKRGRPQVWCPECVLVPFYERNCTPVVVNGETFLVGNEPVEEAPFRGLDEHDPYAHVRPEIEAGMAAINTDHKALYASLVAGGMDVMDASEKAGRVTLAATLNLYADLLPNFYKPGREIEDV